MMGRQLMLLVLLLVGIVTAKCRLMDAAGRDVLARVLLNVLMPCAVFSAFLVDRPGPGQMAGFAAAMAAGLLYSLASFFLAKLLYRRVPQGQRAVLRHGITVNNIAYVGIPVIGGYYGAEGLLYLSAMFVPSNFFMWGFGLTFFTGSAAGGRASLRKALFQPVIVSLALGLLFLFTPLRLPGFLNDAVSALGGCTTPVAMLIIGGILAGVAPRSVFSLRALGYCALRLVAIPLACLGVLWLLGAPAVLSGAVVVSAGLPMAVATAILATQHGADDAFASKLVFLSTLCSMLTLPLLAWLTGTLFAA